MNRKQMEDAVSEVRELIALFEQGKLEPKGTEINLKRILRDREGWLRGEVFVLTSQARALSDVHLGKNVKDKFTDIEEGARTYDQPEAIEYLRSKIFLNHEPLRKIEQAWLDSIFVRDRMSKWWIGFAAVVLANTDQTGIHVGDYSQIPCRCPDFVGIVKPIATTMDVLDDWFRFIHESREYAARKAMIEVINDR